MTVLERSRLVPVAIAAALFSVSPVAAQIAADQVWPRTEVEAGFAIDYLSGAYSDWTETYARIQHRPSPGISVHAESLRAVRFGLSDFGGRLGASFGQGGWHASAEAGVSPTHRVLPSYSLLADLSGDLGGGWQVGAGARLNEYAAGRVTVGRASIERYIGAYRAGYTFTSAVVDGETAPGHALSLSRYYGEGSGITGVVGTGRGVERIGAEDLLTTRSRSVAVWGVHWVLPRVGVTYGAGWDRQKELFDRTRVQLGARARL